MGKKLETLKNLLYERDANKKLVFDQQEAPMTEEEKRQLADTVARYSEIVEAMLPKQNLEEMMTQVSNMVESAGKYIKENEDQIEKLQAGRIDKLMVAATNEAKKACNEMMIARRRLGASLDDIGEALNKYF
jgi:methionyl-tRNA synthetase